MLMSACRSFFVALFLTGCFCWSAMAQVEATTDEYWGTLLDPHSELIARGTNLTKNVYCSATWLTPEYYIVRKVRQLVPKGLSTEEVNAILKKMFKEEAPADLVEMIVVFRWTPDGPEYTLPGNIASDVVLSNDQGLQVEGKLKEKLVDDLTLRRNWEYRSMLLNFDRYVAQGKDGKKVDILKNTKSITLDLPYVTKAGKSVSFTWTLPIKYPYRPREMARLVDFPHDKFRVVR